MPLGWGRLSATYKHFSRLAKFVTIHKPTFYSHVLTVGQLTIFVNVTQRHRYSTACRSTSKIDTFETMLSHLYFTCYLILICDYHEAFIILLIVTTIYVKVITTSTTLESSTHLPAPLRFMLMSQLNI